MALRVFGFVPMCLLAVHCDALFVVNGRCAAAEPIEPMPADVVCRVLLNDYVLSNRKSESDTVQAAIQLIASRARMNGEWHFVLKKFQESDVKQGVESPSARLLTILTKMLRWDGHARWLFKHPEQLKHNAWAPSVELSPKVLDTIIVRAKEADRNQLDAYVVAVVAAHDKRGMDFLHGVLNSEPAGSPRPPGGNVDAKFHAAIGLAELGDRSDLAWLIESKSGDFMMPRSVAHRKAAGHMPESRLYALADLTGLQYQSLEEWQTWWKQSAEAFEPKSLVDLQYP